MVIFDLDGTLYRTHETTVPALRELCRRYQIALSPEDERYLMYTTIQELLDRVAPAMPKERQQRFIRDMNEEEIRQVQARDRLFDGVQEMLAFLAERGVDMAICGMGRPIYIETVLARCGIRRYFRYVMGRKEGRPKGQALRDLLQKAGKSPIECLMVGDSITDRRAAEENGVPFLGVSYGYGRDELCDLELAHSVEQLQSRLAAALEARQGENGT